MARPKVHDDKLRERLLDHAGAMLSADGLDALSLRTLARACGTSTTAVYSLFGGKPGLLTALFDEAFRRLGQHLATVVPGDDPVEDIVAIGRAYRASALAEPHLYAVMFTGRTLLSAAAESRTAAGTALGPLRECVGRAIAAGALRPGTDAATTSLAVWAAVHGWVSLQLRGFLPPSADLLFDDALRAIVSGWRPAQAPAQA